jgi:hypothetical protein
MSMTGPANALQSGCSAATTCLSCEPSWRSAALPTCAASGKRLSAALDCLADTMTVRPRSATVTFRVVEATPRGFASSRSATIGRSGVEPRRGEDRMREGQSARAFVELSDTLVRDYDVVEFLSRLCQRSVEVLEVTAAGALLTDGARRLQVVAASTETVDGPGDAANPGPGGPMRRRLPQRPAGGRAGPPPDGPALAGVHACHRPRPLRRLPGSPQARTDHRDRPDPGIAAAATRTRRATPRRHRHHPPLTRSAHPHASRNCPT